jgi:hypothetical protein
MNNLQAIHVEHKSTYEVPWTGLLRRSPKPQVVSGLQVICFKSPHRSTLREGELEWPVPAASRRRARTLAFDFRIGGRRPLEAVL